MKFKIKICPKCKEEFVAETVNEMLKSISTCEDHADMPHWDNFCDDIYEGFVADI